jgi:hypothetical protein
MKCEVNGCNRSTDTFLCKKHQDMAEQKNAVFKVCNGCSSIVNIEIKIKPKNKHTFVEKCESCNFFK